MPAGGFGIAGDPDATDLSEDSNSDQPSNSLQRETSRPKEAAEVISLRQSFAVKKRIAQNCAERVHNPAMENGPNDQPLVEVDLSDPEIAQDPLVQWAAVNLKKEKESKARIQRLQAELVELHKKSEAAVIRSNAELTEKQQQLENAGREREVLRQEMAARIAALERQLAESVQRETAAQGRLVGLQEEAEARAKELEEENCSFRDMIADIEGELERREQRLAELENDYAQLQQYTDSFEVLKPSLDSFLKLKNPASGKKRRASGPPIFTPDCVEPSPCKRGRVASAGAATKVQASDESVPIIVPSTATEEVAKTSKHLPQNNVSQLNSRSVLGTPGSASQPLLPAPKLPAESAKAATQPPQRPLQAFAPAVAKPVDSATPAQPQGGSGDTFKQSGRAQAVAGDKTSEAVMGKNSSVVAHQDAASTLGAAVEANHSAASPEVQHGGWGPSAQGADFQQSAYPHQQYSGPVVDSLGRPCIQTESGQWVLASEHQVHHHPPLEPWYHQARPPPYYAHHSQYANPGWSAAPPPPPPGSQTPTTSRSGGPSLVSAPQLGNPSGLQPAAHVTLSAPVGGVVGPGSVNIPGQSVSNAGRKPGPHSGLPDVVSKILNAHRRLGPSKHGVDVHGEGFPRNLVPRHNPASSQHRLPEARLSAGAGLEERAFGTPTLSKGTASRGAESIEARRENTTSGDQTIAAPMQAVAPDTTPHAYDDHQGEALLHSRSDGSAEGAHVQPEREALLSKDSGLLGSARHDTDRPPSPHDLRTQVVADESATSSSEAAARAPSASGTGLSIANKDRGQESQPQGGKSEKDLNSRSKAAVAEVEDQAAAGDGNHGAAFGDTSQQLTEPVKRKRGRPKGSKNRCTTIVTPMKVKRKLVRGRQADGPQPKRGPGRPKTKGLPGAEKAGSAPTGGKRGRKPGTGNKSKAASEVAHTVRRKSQSAELKSNEEGLEQQTMDGAKGGAVEEGEIIRTDQCYGRWSSDDREDEGFVVHARSA